MSKIGKIRARITIGGDTDLGEISVEDTKQYFDQGYFAEMDGLAIGDVETLKSELELKEAGGGCEGKEREIPNVTFLRMVAGG